MAHILLLPLGNNDDLRLVLWGYKSNQVQYTVLLYNFQ